MPALQHRRASRLTPIGAQAFAARNLELLAAIENTLDALSTDIRLFRAIDAGYAELHDKLQDMDTEIDAGGRIQAMLEKAGAACARIYRDASARHQSACQDPQLQTDDGVADAYADCMQALRALHDTIEMLREWIATHDAVLQPATAAVYASAGDLFAALLPRS